MNLRTGHARWATRATRRPAHQLIRDAWVDLHDVAVGWRWGRRPLVPHSAEAVATPEAPAQDAGSWARTLPVRMLREAAQLGVVVPLVRSQLSLDVHGVEVLAGLGGPALIVANHSSHLDTPVLVSTLPAHRRRTVAVAAAADYFFDAWWRACGSAVIFNTLPIGRSTGEPSPAPAELLGAGWSLIVYPEGTRSRDGFLGPFDQAVGRLAIDTQVPVVPVGLRGTYAAMPRGQAWPARGRPRVSVRYGTPLRPAPGQSPEQFAAATAAAVQRLIDEDATSWWATQRAAGTRPEAPPAASWRRIWQQTETPDAGGQPRPTKIWRR